MRVSLSALPILVALASPASAQFLNGNDLLNHCSANPFFARAYIIGVADTIMLAQENKMVQYTFCLRPGMDARQVSEIACSYLQATPTFRDFPATSLISMALSSHFPCS